MRCNSGDGALELPTAAITPGVRARGQAALTGRGCPTSAHRGQPRSCGRSRGAGSLPCAWRRPAAARPSGATRQADPVAAGLGAGAAIPAAMGRGAGGWGSGRLRRRSGDDRGGPRLGRCRSSWRRLGAGRRPRRAVGRSRRRGPAPASARHAGVGVSGRRRDAAYAGGIRDAVGGRPGSSRHLAGELAGGMTVGRSRPGGIMAVANTWRRRRPRVCRPGAVPPRLARLVALRWRSPAPGRRSGSSSFHRGRGDSRRARPEALAAGALAPPRRPARVRGRDADRRRRLVQGRRAHSSAENTDQGGT